MAGVRALTNTEIRKINLYFSGRKYGKRNRALFMIGIYTGFRVTELLSLRVRDVLKEGQRSTVADYLTVSRRNMKGKSESRTLPLHTEAKKAIRAWLSELFGTNRRDRDCFLFRSRKGENTSISRKSAWRIIREAADACGISGRIGTHSCRKTFAERVRKNLGGDLFKVQHAMGHKNINSTVKYLGCDQKEIENAVLRG